MKKPSDIILKELIKEGYDKDTAWYLCGNIIRNLRLSGYDITKKPLKVRKLANTFFQGCLL